MGLVYLGLPQGRGKFSCLNHRLLYRGGEVFLGTGHWMVARHQVISATSIDSDDDIIK